MGVDRMGGFWLWILGKFEGREEDGEGRWGVCRGDYFFKGLVRSRDCE